MSSPTPCADTAAVPQLDWDSLRGAAYASCRNMPRCVPRDDILQDASLAAWQAAARWREDGGASLAGFVARRVHFLKDRTNDDVGRDLGVTGPAVSLIGKSALRQLRQDGHLRDWAGLAP